MIQEIKKALSEAWSNSRHLWNFLKNADMIRDPCTSLYNKILAIKRSGPGNSIFLNRLCVILQATDFVMNIR